MKALAMKTLAVNSTVTAAGPLERVNLIRADLRGLRTSPLNAVRVLLIADLLHRVIKFVVGGHAPVRIDADAQRLPTAIVHLARLLDVDPADPATACASPGPADSPTSVTILAGEPNSDAGVDFPSLRVGTVVSSAPADALADTYNGLAVRLALLRFNYDRPAVLSLARLRRAEETLQRWRYKVAMWHDLGSAPAQDTSAIESALAASLDAQAATTYLHRLEGSHDVSSASKFETFNHLDRIVALDLGHLVGKLVR